MAHKVNERLERLERAFQQGRISEETYKELKAKYEAELPSGERERVLFTIDGYRRVNRYLLIFTNKRVVVALVSGGITRVLTAGLLRDMYDLRKARKMKEKDIEELLSSDKNYAIEYRHVKRMDVSKGSRLKRGVIKISKISGESEKFWVEIRKKIDEFEKILRPYLGEKLNRLS